MHPAGKLLAKWLRSLTSILQATPCFGWLADPRVSHFNRFQDNAEYHSVTECIVQRKINLIPPP